MSFKNFGCEYEPEQIVWCLSSDSSDKEARSFQPRYKLAIDTESYHRDFEFGKKFRCKTKVMSLIIYFKRKMQNTVYIVQLGSFWFCRSQAIEFTVMDFSD